MKLKFLLVFSILLIVCCCSSKQIIKLDLNLTEHQKFKIKVVTETNMESNYGGQTTIQTSLSTEIYNYEVKTKFSNGDYLIRSYLVNKIITMNGQTEETDSLELDSIARLRTKPLQKIGDKWSAYYEDLLISPTRQIKKVSTTDIDENITKDIPNATLELFWLDHSNTNIQVGKSWKTNKTSSVMPFNCTDNNKYTLNRIKDGLAEINISMESECTMIMGGSMTTKMDGISYIHQNTGLTKKVTLDVKQSISAGVKAIKKISITLEK